MIVHISTKLLLIGIVINYNPGSFILAVISFCAGFDKYCIARPANTHGRSPPGFRRKSRRVETLTAPDRGPVVTGSSFDRANSPISTSSEDPALTSFPITGNHLIDKEALNIPKEAPVKTASDRATRRSPSRSLQGTVAAVRRRPHLRARNPSL